jgi:hypothetical protein
LLLSVGFSNGVGLDDEGYYDAFVRMFEQANEPVWNSIIEVTTGPVLGHEGPHAQLDVKDRFGSEADPN